MMNIEKALTYPFEDHQWAGKVGIGVLISLVPILNFAWLGYMVELMRQVTKGNPLPMPDWNNLGKKFMDGLFLFLAGFVYALPVILLVGVPLAFMIVPAIMAGNTNNQNIANAIATAGGLVAMCLTCLFILYALALSVIFPAIYVEFAAKGTFASCFNFKDIFAQIRKNTGMYFTAWAVYLGVTIGASLVGGIIGGLLGWIPCLGQLVAVVVGVASGIYALLVFAHLFGQYGAADPAAAPLASS
jgi:hypothetical protein